MIKEEVVCAGVIKKFIDWDVLPHPNLTLPQLEELLSYAQAAGAACAATSIGTTSGVSSEKVQEILDRGGD